MRCTRSRKSRLIEVLLFGVILGVARWALQDFVAWIWSENVRLRKLLAERKEQLNERNKALAALLGASVSQTALSDARKQEGLFHKGSIPSARGKFARSPWTIHGREQSLDVLQKLALGNEVRLQLLPHDVRSESVPNILYGCASAQRKVDGIELHVLVWPGAAQLATLLRQLGHATYNGWQERIPLHIHLCQGTDSASLLEAEPFAWAWGPKTLDLEVKCFDSPGGWVKVLGEAAHRVGDNTLFIAFDDNVQVSPTYFQWLLKVVDTYARTPLCRDANLMGISLSPNQVQQMNRTKRWEVPDMFDAKTDQRIYHSAYLAVLPSRCGAAYWSDRWRDFATFLQHRTSPSLSKEAAEARARVNGEYDFVLATKEIVVDGSPSKFRPKSWKQFMTDFMYARGLLMVYPTFKRDIALVTCTSGMHRNVSTSELVNRLTPSETTLPRYGDLAVFNVHLKASTREQVVIDGTTFLSRVLMSCDRQQSRPEGTAGCERLVKAWARPGTMFKADRATSAPICAADVSAPSAVFNKDPRRFEGSYERHNSSISRYLLFEPEYGANNQYFAIANALHWAAALDRILVLPPFLMPRASVFDVSSGHEVDEWPRAEDIFAVGSSTGGEAGMLGDFAELPFPVTMSFRDWIQTSNEHEYRVIRVTRDAVADNPSDLLAKTLQLRLHSLRNRSHGNKQMANNAHVNLRYLFESDENQKIVRYPSLLDVQNLLGGCGDRVLLFQGMYFAYLRGTYADSNPELVGLSPKASGLLGHLFDLLTSTLVLGPSAQFACFHVRRGDFDEVCQDAEHGRSNIPGFNSLARKGYQCSVSVREVQKAVRRIGMPFFLMSDEAAFVEEALRTSSVPTPTFVTSAWVRARTEEKLGKDSKKKTADAITMVLEQQMCAFAAVSVLNHFSTVSKRVANMQIPERVHFWHKDQVFV